MPSGSKHRTITEGANHVYKKNLMHTSLEKEGEGGEGSAARKTGRAFAKKNGTAAPNLGETKV